MNCFYLFNVQDRVIILTISHSKKFKSTPSTPIQYNQTGSIVQSPSSIQNNLLFENKQTSTSSSNSNSSSVLPIPSSDNSNSFQPITFPQNLFSTNNKERKKREKVPLSSRLSKRLSSQCFQVQDNNLVQCNLCEASYSATDGKISNIILHYQNNHPERLIGNEEQKSSEVLQLNVPFNPSNANSST
jgi:hypothetical protein